MRGTGLCAVLVATALAAGCGGEPAPEISVVPGEAGVESAVRVDVRGLEPGEAVTLTATMADWNRTRWQSTVRLRAGRDGVARADSGATGLLWSMKPERGEAELYVPPLEGARLRVEARTETRPAAARAVTRRTASEGVESLLFLPRGEPGINGELYTPAGEASGAAVLVLGGSEGGLSTGLLAARLAAHGHPALALAYFDEEGLPTGLWRIRLEYFAKALRRLRAEARTVVILGISRGSEAAFLTAARHPRLVDGAIGIAPSAYAGPGDFGRPAWTHRGQPVPHLTVAQFGHPSLSPERARIPLERAGVPVLTAAGGDDETWPSADYARIIHRHLRGRGHRRLVYPEAGHGIGTVLPNLPGWSDVMGGSPRADATARADLWREMLRFLQAV